LRSPIPAPHFICSLFHYTLGPQFVCLFPFPHFAPGSLPHLLSFIHFYTLICVSHPCVSFHLFTFPHLSVSSILVPLFISLPCPESTVMLQ
jgi:hypothetical protein